MGKIFFHEYLRPAVTLLILFTLVLGFLYPGAVTLTAQGLFPEKASGSLIYSNNKLLGSELIGQQFTSPKYFWSRLSATTSFPYNGTASYGSNYGVNNPALISAAKARIDALKGKGQIAPIPVDLVTASASGLDPEISLAAAYYQIPRVAKARNIDEKSLKGIVDGIAEGRQLGVLGEQRVNVLKLNMALDGRK